LAEWKDFFHFIRVINDTEFKKMYHESAVASALEVGLSAATATLNFFPAGRAWRAAIASLAR
jgi:hypothetical protein